MKPEIVVMLTHHDVTVPDARTLFQECADLPVTFWGLKDVGLEQSEMVKLIEDFRSAGKVPVLEVVRFAEAEALEAAHLARDCGIEYFTGARFSASVLAAAQDAGMKYFPFCGEVSGEQVILSGSAAEIIDDANRILADGADGVDLVAYRAVSADPVDLTRQVVQQAGAERVIVAGSITTLEQVRIMEEIGPMGFTMGGALFESKFVPDGSFRENLQTVLAAQDTMRGGLA